MRALVGAARKFPLLLPLAVLLSCSDSASGPDSPSESDILTLTISPRIDTLPLGGSRQFDARMTNQRNERRDFVFDWRAVDPSILNVSRLGYVTAVGPGATKLIASASNKADTASVFVSGGVEAMQVTPLAVSAFEGDSLKFTASLRTTNGAIIEAPQANWSSSDNSVATVGGNGVVASVGAGTATISAEFLGSQAVAHVSVKRNDVASVAVNPAVSSIYPGANVQLSATLLDGNGRVLTRNNVMWSSSNPTLATVSSSGLVTARATGSVVITASSADKSASATVTILGTAAASVTVSLAQTSVSAGTTVQASATLKDGQGNPLNGRTIAWYSSDPSLATVNSTGLVSALKTGSVSIRAVADGVIGNAPLSITPGVSTAIRIGPSGASLYPGQSAQFIVEVIDQNGSVMSNQIVSWSSSTTSVATVAPSGLVTAVAVGTSTITATSGALSASVTVTVNNVPATSITVSPSSRSLKIDETVQESAVVRDANGNVLTRPVNWSSSNSSVATVSAVGLVTAKAAGSATITASTDGVSGSSQITVAAPAPGPVATVTVTLNSSSLAVGQSTQAAAELRDANGTIITGRTVTWSSPNTTLVSVSSSGLVTAIAAGSAAVVATVDGISGATTVTVAAPAPVSVAAVSVTASRTSLTGAGDETELHVTLRDASGNTLTNRTIAYATSNPTVATVNASGVVTGVGPGGVNLSASSEGKTGSVALTVAGTTTPSVATVTVTLGSPALVVGLGTQAQAVLRDASGNVISGSVTWSSANTSVATVSASGYVTAVGAGSASISASSGGKQGSANVSVATTSTAVATVSVNLAASSVLVGQATQASAVLKDAAGNLTTGSVSWSSSNPSVASVSSSGVVTAVAAGSASITATSSGKSGSASISASAPSSGGTMAARAALPNAYMNTQWVAPTGNTITVNAGQNLQAALDAAMPGDVIMLQPGATFVGPFYLRKKSGSGWITIRSAAPDAQLPPPGTRITPAYASVLPKIVTPGFNEPAIWGDPGSHHYRLMGLEVTAQSSVTQLGSLLRIGDANTDLGANIPSNFIFDRIYIHGSPTLSLQRCLLFSSTWTAVIDSYVSECHADGFDSQAIAVWNGPGPFKFVNNHLEGAGENVMFGGANSNSVTSIPSDIEIRGNYIYKPASWIGSRWTIKNLFELKFARRVLVEGNVFDGSWVQAQTGYAMVLKTSGAETWVMTEDVTIRYNRIRYVGGGIAMKGFEGNTTIPARRLTIHDNVFENVNVGSYTGDGRFFTISQGVEDVTINHNTMVTTGYLNSLLMLDVAPAVVRLTMNNNIAMRGEYGIKGMGEGKSALDTWVAGYEFLNNLIIGTTSNIYPSTTMFTSSISNVPFANVTAGDYTLTGGTFKSAGTDGKDLGADMTSLKAATAKAVVP